MTPPRNLRCLVLLLAPLAFGAQPIRLHPDNPRYFEFRGKPFLVVTSAEHYGALLNADFNYQRYFEGLAASGMRMTRFFTGVYRESPESFGIARNTLAPTADRFITPYPRTAVPGAADGGNKWDLTRWNLRYWERLKDIVKTASDRGIITQVVLFCTYYDDSMWKANPFFAGNNVNGTPDVPRTEVLTLKHPELLRYQEALVRRIVTELNEFDNVTYEICNEPYFHGVTLEWQRRIAQIVADTERNLPNKHLIAQNIANFAQPVADPDPNVSILHFHYARPPVTVAMNYGLNRVIGFDETGFDGTLDAVYRIQAWDFILAGGGHYNHLDYSFTAGHEDGAFPIPATQPGGGSPALRKQLKTLIDFMDRFDFVRMAPRDEWIAAGVPGDASARMLAEPGRAYALYLHHGKPLRGYQPAYAVKTARARASLALNVPAGRYAVRWLHPGSGKAEPEAHVEHSGGLLWLTTPEYATDLALDLRIAP
ncbi:MAG: hypothetical protein KIT09_32620 [Bryobacteraceae bacterium]|nr:hypothetical protein [Bryobacteraceae bacterium]